MDIRADYAFCTVQKRNPNISNIHSFKKCVCFVRLCSSKCCRATHADSAVALLLAAVNWGYVSFLISCCWWTEVSVRIGLALMHFLHSHFQHSIMLFKNDFLLFLTALKTIYFLIYFLKGDKNASHWIGKYEEDIEAWYTYS